MRLLILEDDPIVARQISSLAEQFGHQVDRTVADAGAAVELAVALRPDLLIADVDLGQGGDGIRAAVLIRDVTGIKTVFVTAHCDSEVRDRAQHAWPMAFLTKPLDPMTFRDVLAGIADLMRGHPR